VGLSARADDSDKIYKDKVWSVAWIVCFDDNGPIGSGSGFVVEKWGDDRFLVFTCAHVVEAAFRRHDISIAVLFPHPDSAGDPVVDEEVEKRLDIIDGKVYGALAQIPGWLQGYATFGLITALDSKRDLAALDCYMLAHPPARIRPVLKIDPSLDDLINHYQNLDPGDRLQIIGNPGGRPQWRSVLGEFKSSERFQGRYTDDAYERDYECLRFLSAAWGGNSGGPVFDDEGFLVGVLSAGGLSSGGISRAIGVLEVAKFLSTINVYCAITIENPSGHSIQYDLLPGYEGSNWESFTIGPRDWKLHKYALTGQTGTTRPKPSEHL
jgi:hypothetical protein